MMRAYSIEIDGDKIGTIKEGETKDIPIDEGAHIVKLKIDWACSNELQINVSSGEDINLECGNAMRGWKIILVIFYTTIWRKKYLWIEEI